MGNDSEVVGPKGRKFTDGDPDQQRDYADESVDAVVTHMPGKFIPRVAAHSKRSLACLRMLKEFE